MEYKKQPFSSLEKIETQADLNEVMVNVTCPLDTYHASTEKQRR